MPKSKKKTLEYHTSKRLKERYGLNYSQLFFDSAMNQIRNGKAKLVLRQSLRVTIWDVVYDVREKDIYNSEIAKQGQQTIRVVYDKTRKTLITVLSPDMDPVELELELDE